MSARELRVADNESQFRVLNEGIEQVLTELDDATVSFVCECGLAECDERLPIGIAKYEEVRASPVRFVVKPGHEIDDVEDVVERGEGFYVVEKSAEAGASVAREQDPRT